MGTSGSAQPQGRSSPSPEPGYALCSHPWVQTRAAGHPFPPGEGQGAVVWTLRSWCLAVAHWAPWSSPAYCLPLPKLPFPVARLAPSPCLEERSGSWGNCSVVEVEPVAGISEAFRSLGGQRGSDPQGKTPRPPRLVGAGLGSPGLTLSMVLMPAELPARCPGPAHLPPCFSPKPSTVHLPGKFRSPTQARQMWLDRAAAPPAARALTPAVPACV